MMPINRIAGCVLAVTLLVIGCTDQPTSPEPTPDGRPEEIVKPLFNHAPPPGYGLTVAANNYHLSFNDQGLLPASPWDGAGTYQGLTVLYAGSIAYGTGDQAVYFYNTRGTGTSYRGTWLPYPRIDELWGIFADHQTVSVMIESVDGELQSRTPIGLVTIRETFAYVNPPDDDYVIVKYTLLNPHHEDLTGLHVGQILDSDIGITSDWVWYDPTKRLVLVDTWWTNIIAGHVALTGTVSTYQRWRSASSRPVSPDVIDPATLAGWYGLLSSGMADPAFWGPSDVRHLLAEGPITIPAGGSHVIAFALVAGDGLADLYTNADAALAKWASLPAEATGPYQQPLIGLSIDPRVINLAAPGVFSVEFQFSSAAEASLATPDGVMCSGARPFRANKASASTVRAFFKTADLFARLRPGESIVCDGRLSDGTRYVGAAAPMLIRAVTPVTQLTFDPANDRDPSWSPDGRSIVFASDRGRAPHDPAIWRMDVAAGEGSAVQLTSTSGRQPDWSPDGSTIVWAGGHIFTVPAAGGTVTTLTASPSTDWYPQYSPDGAEIVFRREVAHGSPPVKDLPTIWKMTAAGELAGPPAVPLATDGYWHEHPTWSADGQDVYFVSDRPGIGMGIFAVDAAIGEPAIRITPAEEFWGDYHQPAHSPDGRTLAFLSQGTFTESNIILQDLRAGTHTAVLMDPPLPVRTYSSNLEYSPDGRRLAFASGGDIYIAELGDTP